MSIEPEGPEVELWTDGSGTVMGQPGGWACVLRQKRDGEWVEREISGAAESTTNNRMELTALMEGLRALRRPCNVVVYTDSEYVANPFIKGWLPIWKARNWSKVKNSDLWKEILRRSVTHRLELSWVKGHSGVDLNERCDKLAGQERANLMEIMAKELAF
ncbi:MAG: ribonuclease H [Solirubrobacteraceae bacterium]